jgi:hypothetical protein
MSALRDYAKNELTRAGFFDKDALYGGMLGDAVMKMVDVFADEGHSGMSAGLAVSAFQKVAMFQPLTPLTGEDDEWSKIGDDDYQNKRASTVFKRNGEAYDIKGRIFREPSGACFTSRDSRVLVTFPYTPSREYVDVSASVEE